MRTTFRTLTILAGLTVFAAPAAQAQMGSGSGPSQVALSAKKAEVLTLTLSAASLTNLDLVANPVLGSITATMGWTLNASRSSVQLVGWFASTTALTDGASPATTIATTDVTAACTNADIGTCATGDFGGTATLAPGAIAGASMTLWTSPPINGTNRTGSEAVDIELAIKAAAVTALPAGTYTGTLNVRAFAN